MCKKKREVVNPEGEIVMADKKERQEIRRSRANQKNRKGNKDK